MKTMIATTLALVLGGTFATAAVARDGDVRRYQPGHASSYDSRHDGRYDRRHDRDVTRYQERRHEQRRHDGRTDSAKHRPGGRYEVDPTWRYDRYRDRYSHYDRYYRNYDHRWRAPSRYVPPRGYYRYRWDVGYRLPPAYYGRSYYVDHRHYRLAPPPYGHRYVRVDNDVFLVALTSGLITYALHDLFHH